MLGGNVNATATATGGRAIYNGFNVADGGAATANATSTAMLGGNAAATATATGGNEGTFGGGIAGAANANSFATTINGNMAQAQSTASGSSGQAQATAQTNFGGSARFKLSPQARLVVARHQPTRSHRRVIPFLFPTRSMQGRAFRL